MFKNQQHIVHHNTPALRFRKTVLILALSQILVLSAPEALAARIRVNTDSGGANDPHRCALRDAITAANTDTATGGCPAGAGADTIILPVKATITLTEPDNLDNGLPVVTSAITIEGNGTTINRDSGNPEFRIFEVNKGSLELKDTLISGGHIYGEGGGIFVHDSSSVTLINTVIEKNRGGGIKAQESSSVTLMNSKVLRNRSNSDYYLSVGGILVLDSSVTLTNSTVSGNNGGGINARSSSVALADSTISKNIGMYCGGGGIDAWSGQVTLTNSTVSANFGCGGGGINIDNGTVTLINSTVSGNSTETEASGINAFNSTIILTNSTVAGNSSQPDVRPGGIRLHSYSPRFQPDFVLQNSIVANNAGGDCINDAGITPREINSLIGDGGINCGIPLLTGDPKLDRLWKNGGPTKTHALLVDSPAIDAGDDAICATLPKNATGQPTDQRGQSRTDPAAGLHCDLGAYEFQTQVADNGGQ